MRSARGKSERVTGRTSASQAGQSPAERKAVTVLFADLTGFTAIAERLDLEDVHAFLKPLLDTLEGIVREHGGTVTTKMGDGFMAVFGTPQSHEDDAERAVRVALAMREHVRRLRASSPSWPGSSDLHVGIQTGEVLVAPSAEGLDIVGDPVNTAARLLGVAPAGCLLVGEETHRLTTHAVRYLAWAPIRLKGKHQATHAYQLIGIAPPIGPSG